MENKKSKLDIPYYKVAKSALMEWYKLSEGDAISEIENSEWEEIEKKVDAVESLTYAVDKISKSLDFTDDEVDRLLNNVFDKGIDAIELMKSKIEEKGIDPTAVAIDTLFAVHDGWVEGHPEKFMARDRKHQHMPSELIGWNEAKKDLLFIKPIFEAAGIEVNEEELEKEYNRRVKEFFLSKDITSTEKLEELLAKGGEFYPALKGQTEIIEFLQGEDVSKVITQIKDFGIGSVTSTRRHITEGIVDNPTKEDLDRLTKEEKDWVNLNVGIKLRKATEELEVAKKIDRVVEEILNKNEELQKVNKEIEKLKSKRKDTDNRNDFGE